jgi:hypothetical protein
MGKPRVQLVRDSGRGQLEALVQSGIFVLDGEIHNDGGVMSDTRCTVSSRTIYLLDEILE